jgi:hypothetical protein
LADPRAGDVAEAERLIERAAKDGIARLPVLSAAEIWVLCGDRQVLADETELDWWMSKTDDEREQYGTAMVDLLVDRGLIRRADDPASARLPMTAELAMIVAARQLPAVVVVCTLSDGSSDNMPRMYGLAEADRPPRVLVSEVVADAKRPAFGALHHFSLVSPARAGRILALWAGTPDKAGFLTRKASAGHRLIDVYRHRPGEQLSRDRIIVGATARALEVTRQRADGRPEPASHRTTDELASMVTAMLEESAP